MRVWFWPLVVLVMAGWTTLLPALAVAQSIRGGTLQTAQSVGAGTPLDVEGFSVVGLSILGTAGADRVVNWEGSQDGVNYGTIQCTPLGTGVAATTTAATGVTVILVRCQVAGLTLLQARLSGGTTGTVTITGTALGHQ